MREIDDLFQVRLNLELMAASLACKQAPEAGLKQLLAMVERMVLEAELFAADRAGGARPGLPHGHLRAVRQCLPASGCSRRCGRKSA
ncbi:FCD domain-containing protein [Cupriavidus basilensis]